MIPGSNSKRLYAALALSCLLHAATIVLPYLGTGSADFRLAVTQGQKPRPGPVLRVRLLEEGMPAAATEAPSAVTVVAQPAGQAGAPSNELRPAPPPPPKVGGLPFPAPAYYTADQLTKRPRPTSEPDLGTPVSGRAFPSGLVILRLWISELGTVAAVDVETTDLPEVLAERAAVAFSKLRFEPGEIAGRRVPALVRIEVTYNEPATVPR